MYGPPNQLKCLGSTTYISNTLISKFPSKININFVSELNPKEHGSQRQRIQEAHGPYCSPEKTVQIHKHMIIS